MRLAAATHLQLVLLQELLGQVLKVPLGEVGLSGKDELGSWKEQSGRVTKSASRAILYQDGSIELTIPLQLDVVTQLTGLSLDLDAVVQELLVTSGIEDLVTSGDRVVHDELVGGLGGGGGSFRLSCGRIIVVHRATGGYHHTSMHRAIRRGRKGNKRNG
jgi:hypothetical protein